MHNFQAFQVENHIATAHVSNAFRSSTFLIGRFAGPIINLETFTSKEHGSYSKTGTIYRFNLFEAMAKSKKKIISILSLTRASVISKNTNHVVDQRMVLSDQLNSISKINIFSFLSLRERKPDYCYCVSVIRAMLCTCRD